MNNDIDPDIRPGTEDRVAAALRSLAAIHTPDASSANPASVGSRRWMLAVAASAVLVVGVGALLLASNRETDSAADRLPQTASTTVSSEPAESGTVLPAVPPVAYSETPLGDDVVPVLVPPPSEPVRGFELGSTTSTWTRGIENATLFAVLDGADVVGAVQVFDLPAPWDVFAKDQNVVNIDGREAIRIEGSDERGLVVRVGDGVRAALDGSPPSDPLSIDDDIAELVALLGDGPLDEFGVTDRFARAPLDLSAGVNVSYGSQGSIELFQVRLEPGATGDAVDLLEGIYQLSIEQTETAQASAVVQVSPTDLVVIVADNEDDLATAQAHLQLLPRDESGIDFTTFSGPTDGDVIARGEPSWGRWQVTADPSDAGCSYFHASKWGIDASGRGYSDCGERNPVRADGSRVYCVVLDVEIVGAVLGATTQPEFAIRDDIDGLAAEWEDTSNSEFGVSSTFRIAQTEPGANIRAAAVLVDGVEIGCG